MGWRSQCVSPDRSILYRQAIIPKNAIRLLAQRPSGGWVGVDSDRLKEAQQGRRKKKSTRSRMRSAKSWKKSYKRAQDDYLMIVGSPKTVIEKIKTMIRVLRAGDIRLFPGSGASRQRRPDEQHPSDGPGGHSRGQRIRPRKSTWSISSPAYRVRSKLTPGTRRLPVVDRTPLKDLGMQSEA